MTAVAPDHARGSQPRRKSTRGGEPRRQARKQPRLSINLNPEAADFLDEVTTKRGISYTEAVRRALAIYKLVEDQAEMGNQIQINDGKKVQQLVVI